MICLKCGTKLPDGLKFCYQCGADTNPRPSYTDLPAGTLVECPKCKAKNLRTESKCARCDADLFPVKTALSEEIKAEPGKFKSRCMNCSADNPAEALFCGECGGAMIRNFAPGPMGHMGAAAEMLEGWVVAFFYIVSFFVPPIGVVLGAVLITSASHPRSEYRQVGNACLIIAAIAMVIAVLVGFVSLGVGWLRFGS